MKRLRRPEHNAAIGAALTGFVREHTLVKTCRCGAIFTTASHNARFCSRECKRAAAGHGLRHAPHYQHFPQRCGICGSADELVGDHDHATGAARGILCRRCNLALGNMADDPARLRAAADYLELHAKAVSTAVYLCGPMSGLPDNNYPAFHRAAREMRALGLRVENPAENTPPSCGSWAGWMRLSIQQLMRCTTIAMLPGWQNSRGARLEHHIASELGMVVVDAAGVQRQIVALPVIETMGAPA